MAFYIDDENISLLELRERIQDTDLVPSRASVLDKIEANFKALEQQGITSLAALRYELKTSRRLESLSSKTKIDAQYLVLLRREIESYFPKPVALNKFDWFPEGEISKLNDSGIRNNVGLYHAIEDAGSLSELAGSTGSDLHFLETFARLVDLTRIQWVSPLTARMLAEAGFDGTKKVAAADPEDLCEALTRVNQDNKYFKGKVGLRDIKRLIKSAGYVLKHSAS